MTDLRVGIVTLFTATGDIEIGERYCLYDPKAGTFSSDGRRIRTYTTKPSARGALSRVNHGQLPDKRK